LERFVNPGAIAKELIELGFWDDITDEKEKEEAVVLKK
jgi:hypothetical protein